MTANSTKKISSGKCKVIIIPMPLDNATGFTNKCFIHFLSTVATNVYIYFFLYITATVSKSIQLLRYGLIWFMFTLLMLNLSLCYVLFIVNVHWWNSALSLKILLRFKSVCKPGPVTGSCPENKNNWVLYRLPQHTD